MDADSVRNRVLQELGDRRSTPHGWDFSQQLLDPPVLREYREPDGSLAHHWVVLEESADGYHIIFDASVGTFGLATSGTVVGWYGTFINTVEGM